MDGKIDTVNLFFLPRATRNFLATPRPPFESPAWELALWCHSFANFLPKVTKNLLAELRQKKLSTLTWFTLIGKFHS